MKLKCAVYCRVSTESQRESETIEGQRLQLKRYAKDQDWQITNIYKDEGVSGSFLEGRTDFLKLLEDMAKKKFDILLVAEHSRITRSDDPMERALILKTLQDNEIKIASPSGGIENADTFEGELMFTLKSMFSAKEKRQILERFDRGRKKKLKEGIYCLTSVPYGLKKVVDKTMKPVKHEVVFNDDEVAVLKTVYDMIVNQRKSINDCTYYLNQKDIKSRRGKAWNVGNLSSILRNESLTGIIYTGRYVWKTIGTNPQKQTLIEIKPKDQCHPVKIPAIFTKQEFRLLREKIESNKRSNMVKKEGFLLRGKLRCGMCGALFVPTTGGDQKYKTVRYYCCHNRKKSPRRLKAGEQRCDAPYVNMQVIDGMIEREILLNLFMHPEKTLKDWSDIGKNKKVKVEQLSKKLTNVNKMIVSKQTESKKLLTGFVQGEWSEKEVKGFKKELNGQLEILEEQRRSVQRDLKTSQALQTNIKQLEESSVEIKKLSKRLFKKIVSMPFFEKQKLLYHFIPSGASIEIWPLNEEDIWYTKVENVKRKIRCEWQYSYTGRFDIKATLDALKEFDRSGTIPEPSNNYTNVEYLSLHGGITGE